MKLVKRIIFPFILGFAFAFLIPCLYSYIYIFSSNFKSNRYEAKLMTLGKKSLSSNDVPVAALLLYGGKIIGKGNNDVILNNNPSGHAEINALNDVFKKIGHKKFMSLNREKLTLLTTFEPCPMCKGAIEEYQIRYVVFGLAKRKIEKLQYFKNDLKYYYHLQQMKNKRLQYELFKMNPAFDTIQYPY